VVNFLFVIIEFFCYLLRLRHYNQKSVKVGILEEVGDFERKFQMEGASPIKHCWFQKTRVTALSCGSKISARHCFATKHACDRQTDRTTELQQLISASIGA